MKIFLTLFFIIFTLGAYSQSLVLSAGGSYATVDYKLGTGSMGLDENFAGPGVHGGAFLESVFYKKRKKEFLVAFGLLGDYKMTKQTYDELDQSNDMTLFYLNVPAYIMYRYKLRSRAKIYAGIGPYAGVGLSGKATVVEFGGVAVDHKIKWGSDTNRDDLKRLDYGVTAKVGYRTYGGFDISASYDYGIPDVYTRYESQSMKHRAIRLTIGYAIDLVD